MKGYIQVYSGNGKGKSTTALGLAIRAAGASLKVFIAQFNKRDDYSEIKALKRFSDLITVEQYGPGRFTDGKPLHEEIEAARKGIERVKSILSEGEHQVVVLEEANVAIKDGLFSAQDLLGIMLAKPDHVEIVITGRGASSRIIKNADLVSEIKEVKHYYNQGIESRNGIER